MGQPYGVFEAIHTKSKQHCLGFCLIIPGIPSTTQTYEAPDSISLSIHDLADLHTYSRSFIPTPLLVTKATLYIVICIWVAVNTGACAGHVLVMRCALGNTPLLFILCTAQMNTSGKTTHYEAGPRNKAVCLEYDVD